MSEPHDEPPVTEPPLRDGDFRCLRLETRGKVLVVTLDRAGDDLNAVDATLHAELAALFRGLRRETHARAAVLTGAGRAFSAGGDFDWLPRLRGADVLDHLRRDARQLVWDLLDVEIPVVAALNGHAVGLGASIALLCDAIFMAEDATLADPHVRVGIVAGDGGAVIWPLVLGPARAKQYLLTGDPVTAPEAERLGLVNRVTPRERVLDEALAFAARLAEGAPLAVRYTKLAVNQWIKLVAHGAFDLSTALELVTFGSRDHEEALAALREKRPPRFEGR